MRYFIAGAAVILVPVLAAWKVLYGPEGTIRDHKAAARLSLSDLLESREHEIAAREKVQRALQFDDGTANRHARLRIAAQIVAAAIRDLRRAAYFWDKIIASCNVDYPTCRARKLDNAIEHALADGNTEEVERMFDRAMEHKLTAIELAKDYLERQQSVVQIS